MTTAHLDIQAVFYNGENPTYKGTIPIIAAGENFNEIRKKAHAVLNNLLDKMGERYEKQGQTPAKFLLRTYFVPVYHWKAPCMIPVTEGNEYTSYDAAFASFQELKAAHKIDYVHVEKRYGVVIRE